MDLRDLGFVLAGAALKRLSGYFTTKVSLESLPNSSKELTQWES